MKDLYSLRFLMICALCLGTLLSNAQFTHVTNSQVNFEFRINDSWYGGGNDFDGQADPTIRTDLWVVDQWYGELCSTWDCSGPCYSQAASGIWYAGWGYNMTDEYAIWMRGFESDNSNECSYQDGDDHHWVGYANLRDNQQYQPLVYPSTDFRPCNWNPWLAANGSQWCFQDAANWDQIWAQTWRYVHGDEFGDPLNFGTVSSGETKIDINANRAVSTDSGVALQYTNTDGQSSADVWYEFNINQSSEVTISTAHSETDFDTYLSLFTTAGTLIASNDDAVGLQSTITVNLCAGTYKINAEGYSSNTGLFKVSVYAAALPAPTIGGLSTDPASCADSNDGYAGWWIDNGVLPYTFYWDGNNIGAPSQSGLAPGTYVTEVVDGCGAIGSATVVIENGDDQAPNAECQNGYTLQIVDGSSASIPINDIDDGSSDNCGIESMTISPTSLNSDDGGANTITLTVIDTSGNQSTCTTTVNVEVTVGVDELGLEELSIYPNPNNGTFTLDLSGTTWQTGDMITIYNSIGQVVHSETITQAITIISIPEVSPGVYHVSVPLGNEFVNNQILIKN